MLALGNVCALCSREIWNPLGRCMSLPRRGSMATHVHNEPTIPQVHHTEGLDKTIPTRTLMHISDATGRQKAVKSGSRVYCS